MSKKKVAIIAAHPDDEVFGCGGSILLHKKRGDDIGFLWMTNGIGARIKNQSYSESACLVRKKGHQKSIEFINPIFMAEEDFPDNQLDAVPLLEITRRIENFLSEFKPDVVYTHFQNDLNIDHCLVLRAVLTATRPGSQFFVREIYSFEVPSSTEWSLKHETFTPDTYVDISAVIEEKKAYVQCYADELRAYPHPRSMENIICLNQMRGAHVNMNYAEAFVTQRRVI